MSTEEHRYAQRTRALKGARIVYNHGHSSLNCTIRNLSEGGAKIVVETTIGIPDGFTLMLDDGASHDCSVRWKKITEMGVQFLPA